MREILFKAKRLDNGEWVEGNLVQSEDVDDDFKVIIIPLKESWMYTEEYSNDIGFEGWYKVDPTTLCQYTGLVDKNGQKIWENDILCGHLDEEYPEDITYTKVFWNVSGFHTKENHSIDIEPFDEWYTEHFEVCGNIFDNSELLEVE